VAKLLYCAQAVKQISTNFFGSTLKLFGIIHWVSNQQSMQKGTWKQALQFQAIRTNGIWLLGIGGAGESWDIGGTHGFDCQV
jgi:hypothetical protein